MAGVVVARARRCEPLTSGIAQEPGNRVPPPRVPRREIHPTVPMQFRHLILLAALAPSCISVTRAVSSSSGDPTVLKREERDGTSTTWRLHANRAGAPLLERTDKRQRQVAYMGLTVAALTRARAEALGLAAFSGVVVESVVSGTSAAGAGLRAGDVLLSIDGVPMTSDEQFRDFIANDLAPGANVKVDARRNAREGVESIQYVFDVGQRSTEDATTESLPLRGSRVVRDLTGLDAAELPPERSAELLGAEETTVLVAAVSLGSPAYHAGLRSGDRIVTLDGAPLGGLDPLVAAVLGRADQLGLQVASDERTNLGTQRTSDVPLELGVRGPLGLHTATLDVRGDLDERGEVDIPILFECESDLASTEWSFLDFIFQFGANYRSRYTASVTRQPARHSFFSMLPFGFYEVKKSPGYARYCILWFIEWERRS